MKPEELKKDTEGLDKEGLALMKRVLRHKEFVQPWLNKSFGTKVYAYNNKLHQNGFNPSPWRVLAMLSMDWSTRKYDHELMLATFKSWAKAFLFLAGPARNLVEETIGRYSAEYVGSIGLVQDEKGDVLVKATAVLLTDLERPPHSVLFHNFYSATRHKPKQLDPLWVVEASKHFRHAPEEEWLERFNKKVEEQYRIEVVPIFHGLNVQTHLIRLGDFNPVTPSEAVNFAVRRITEAV